MSDQKPSPETLLAAVLEISGAAERRAYLDHACGGDAALRQEVESLLDANAGAGEFLLHPAGIGAGAGQKTVSMPPPSELTGTRIGHYKLLEQIGEGGFGVVWMAEQEEPVRRRVALKIIKLGMDTREVVARFEAERQALAMMDHPNIASVFDGGATDTGRPYFVMELVKGVPITEYCDANKLSTRERLELFMQVCHAVQHAHQKGVIHRDLKPSNILVTVKDDRPVPKVIDFGVAKATQARLTEKTVFTRFHQWIGTPAYMSPEQAGLGSLDVDTRSDIYSLGVLLYELLTGRTPFDTQKLLAAGYDEVMRTIREQDPPKPSARLSTLAKEELGAVAARRGAEPAKLGRLVRGDLDWIVMKTLEKDRTRRYETANGLALDLERHLGSEPIAAAAPNTFYLVRKYVRRHRTGLVTSASLLLLLLAGTVLSTWQAIKVTNAESKTRTALGLADQARQSAERNQRAAEFALYSGRISRAADLWDKGDVKQAENILDVCPDLLRGWEWRWLKRQCHQEVMSFDGFSSDEESTRKQNGSLELNTPLSWAREGLGFQSGPRLAFSADGTRLIAGNPAGGLCVFDIQTGKPLVRLQGNKTLTSEDGSLLIEAPSGEHAVSIVEIATGNRRAFLLPVESTGDRICFAASLRWAAFSKSDGVTVVSLVDGVRVGFLNCTNEPTLLALSTDSTWLVTTTSGADRDTVWNIRSGKPVFDIKSRPDGETPPGSGKIIFSRDNRRLAVMGCLPGTQPNDEGRELLEVWDLNTARRLFARRCFPGSIAFIGDRYILAPSKSSLHPPFSLEMVLLDAQSGEEVHAVCADNGSSHDERFFEFGFPTGDYWAGMIYGATSISTSLDDHYLALGSMDRTVQIIETLPPFRRQLLRGHYNPVGGVAFSPDAKRLASMDERGTVKIWELSRLETLDLWHRWPEESDKSEFSVSPDARLVIWREKNTDLCWAIDPVSGTRSEQAFHLPRHGPDFRSVVAVRRNLFATGEGAWDAQRSKLSAPFDDRGDGCGHLAVSRNGKLVAGDTFHKDTNADGVAVWSTETGKLLCHLERKCPVGFGPFPYNDGATCLSFSSDGGLIAVVGADGQVTVHCTGFGGGRPKEVSRFQGTEPVLFGPDGTWLLTGRSDGEFQRISAGSGELLRRYKAPRSKQFSEVFAWELSPDCRVALCYSSGLPVIDLETGHVLFEAGGLPWRVWASFSPDGQRLAAPGRNGLLHIWDLGTRTVITELPVSAAFMRFTTDGDYLIVISPEGRLSVLDGRSFRGPQKHGP